MNDNSDALVRYFAEQEGEVILLESQSGAHPSSNDTYVAASPGASITAYDDRITIRRGGEEIRFRKNPWTALQEFRSQQGDWMFGWFGYDLKNHIETLTSRNSDPVGAPDMYFMVPRFLLRIRRDAGEREVIRGRMPGVTQLESAGEADPASFTELKPATARDAYIRKIEEARRLIAEGDYYEVNLSHRLSADFSGSPYDLYRRMRAIGPVPFGAFLQVARWSVCCASPKRFLCKRGPVVFSQPIKGTARRSGDPAADKRHRDRLMQSGKEKAENLMIVDLVRNDLSRIAKEGSVEVPELFEIQSFGTVHQMVSTVRAEAGIDDPVEIIKACFPMGSMTGAPKISAMQSIEALEDYRRGIYSGAIGYMTPGGDFDFNVVIRTAVITAGRLYYAAGGAITGDSDPAAEWEETLVKARALTEI